MNQNFERILRICLQSVRDIGMHQPFPDPPDINTMHPVALLSFMTNLQNVITEKFMDALPPDTITVSVDQYRPGVYLIGPEGKYEYTLIPGIDRLLGDLAERGLIAISNDAP